MELNQIRIENAIVQDVADRLIDQKALRDRVARAVDMRVDTHLREVADSQIKAAIEAAILQGFEREYHRVDSFGRREGQATTIRAELEKVIGDYWNTRVDSQGKPSTNSYGTNITRAEWVMTQLVAADFKGDMKQHVVNLGGVLKDKLRAELPIVEIPLVLMDVSLAVYEKIPSEKALEHLAALIEASNVRGGAFVFLWHNIMRDKVAFPGYWDTFEYFFFAAAGSARFVTLSQLCEEFDSTAE